jgi:TRAP-type C4-dicarboxylate transport system permease large subunit
VRHQVKEYDIKSLTASKGDFKGKEFPLDYLVHFVHFGIIVCVNLGIGALTPPFGNIGYTVCLVAKIPYIEFLKEIWPFIIGMIVVLLLLTFVPQISLFIPRIVLG